LHISGKLTPIEKIQAKIGSLASSIIFAQIFQTMQETAKKSTAIFWILFLLSVVAFFGVYSIGGGYCTLTLPFVVTFFAKALDLI